jgi:hypothetical protein
MEVAEKRRPTASAVVELKKNPEIWGQKGPRTAAL